MTAPGSAMPPEPAAGPASSRATEPRSVRVAVPSVQPEPQDASATAQAGTARAPGLA